jgi:hypothetical protein
MAEDGPQLPLLGAEAVNHITMTRIALGLDKRGCATCKYTTDVTRGDVFSLECCSLLLENKRKRGACNRGPDKWRSERFPYWEPRE